MSKGNTDFEIMAATLGDLCNWLPKGRSACFDIGSNGGCGVDCAEFCRGGCGEPQELSCAEVIDEHGLDDGISILEFYDCFDAEVEAIKNE